MKKPAESTRLVSNKKQLKHLVLWLKNVRNYSDARERAFAVDTETYAPGEKKNLKIKKEALIVDRGRIMFISIARRDMAWAIPVSAFDPKFLPIDVVITALKPFFRDRRIIKVMQNANYDCNMFINHGAWLRNLYCTMMAGQCWDETLPNSLKERCTLVDMLLKKTTTVDLTNLDQITEYAAKDAIATWRLYEAYEFGRKIVHLGEKRNMLLKGSRRKFFLKEMRLLPHVIKMERRGMLLDVEGLNRVDRKIVRRIEKIETKIFRRNGAPFNIKSKAQLGAFIFDKCGVEPYRKTATGKNATDKESFARLRNAHPMVKRIVEHTNLTSLRRFTSPKTGLQLYADDGGRIHSTLKQLGARTARFSCSLPNLMQVPSKMDKFGIRDCFIAPKGKVLIVADKDQVELRLMAIFSKDKMLLRAYKKGESIHLQTGVRCGLLPKKAIDPNLPKEEKDKIKKSKGYFISKNCVSGDSLVKTREGLLRIDELVEDRDGNQNVHPIKIYCEDGKTRAIVQGIRLKNKKTLEIISEHGVKIVVTPDHECMVLDKGRVVRKRADKLTLEDFLLLQVGNELHGQTVNLPTFHVSGKTSYRKIEGLKRLTLPLARWLGYFVAEGSACRNNASYSISMGLSSVIDKDVVKDVRTLFKRLFDERAYESFQESNSSVHWSLSSKYVYYLLEKIGTGMSSVSKEIPNIIRTAPFKFKAEFLKAYFEGDGTVKADRVSCTSKSESLIRTVQAELFNIGIVSSVYSEYRKDYGLFWNCQITSNKMLALFESRIGFIGRRKKALLRKTLDSHKIDRSCLFYDSFDINSLKDASEGKLRDKLNQCIRRSVRLGETIVNLAPNSCLWPRELRQLIHAGYSTVKIKSINSGDKINVYDIYEPEKISMVCNGLLVADCNFGQMYEGTRFTLERQLVLEGIDTSEDECQGVIDVFWQLYAGVPVFRRQLYELCRRLGIVRNISGRPYYTKEINSTNFRARKAAERQAISTCIQGSAAELMKDHMIDACESKVLKRCECVLLMQVHDELIFECPKKYEAIATKEVKRIMETPPKTPIVDLLIQLTASVGSGPSWMRAKG